MSVVVSSDFPPGLGCRVTPPTLKHVKLMKLGHLEGFYDMCKRMGLEVRGKHGEKDKKNSGIFDVSNNCRLGASEVELIQTMMDGVKVLISLEQLLEKGEAIKCSDYPQNDR